MYVFTRFTGKYLLSVNAINVNNVTFTVHVSLTVGDENCQVGVIEFQMTRQNVTQFVVSQEASKT